MRRIMLVMALGLTATAVIARQLLPGVPHPDTDADAPALEVEAGRSQPQPDATTDGDVWVRVRGAAGSVGESEPIVHDFAVLLGPDGRELRRISVLDALERATHAPVATAAEAPLVDLESDGRDLD